MLHDSRAVGAKLRELRQKKGMTLLEAAKRTNKNPAAHSHLSQIENGRMDPQLSTLLRYLEVLEARLAYVKDGRVRELGQDAWGVGDTLTKLRQEKGLTIRQVAKLMNYSGHSHITMIEFGRVGPQLSTLLRFLRVLDARLTLME